MLLKFVIIYMCYRGNDLMTENSSFEELMLGLLLKQSSSITAIELRIYQTISELSITTFMEMSRLVLLKFIVHLEHFEVIYFLNFFSGGGGVLLIFAESPSCLRDVF